MKLVVLGLSLSSSWGNGHATTYRSLLGAFAARGHNVLFLERDVPWYAQHRDLAEPEFCRLAFYEDAESLVHWRDEVSGADAVLVGSYVPDGIEVGDWVLRTAHGAAGFYDIDTPVTLASLARGEESYIAARQITSYAPYLSFTGGPLLQALHSDYGSPMPRALYCSVDTQRYRPQDCAKLWDLSYLGTYSADRQPALERLLIDTARRAPGLRFAVAGSQYPAGIDWPTNVERIEHLAPGLHAAFYGASRFTLNVTRADMIAAGYSPSVRLFEAGACATAIISDEWAGLDTILSAGEIVVAHTTDDVLSSLAMPKAERDAIAKAGYHRILSAHTAFHRAAELEAILVEALLVRRATGHGPFHAQPGVCSVQPPPSAL